MSETPKEQPGGNTAPGVVPPKPSRDFDSVILPRDLGDPGAAAASAGQTSAGQASSVPAASQPAPTRRPTPSRPTPAAKLDTQAPVPAAERPALLSELGPEDFKRTLIHPMSPPAAVASAARSSAPRTPDRLSHPQISVTQVKATLDDPRVFMAHSADSEQAAAFRVLRYRLSERDNPRTLVVTGAERGDGKTTCAVNLAFALSECGRARVLLLEANLRQPSVARMLGIKPPSCAARQIAEHHKNPSASAWEVAEIGSAWLHALAVDPDTFEPSRVVDEPAFVNAISEIKKVGYDYIVIDTSPVLGSADVNLVQDSADAVLLALWARKSSSASLRKAIDQLTATKVLGFVLLNAPA